MRSRTAIRPTRACPSLSKPSVVAGRTCSTASTRARRRSSSCGHTRTRGSMRSSSSAASPRGVPPRHAGRGGDGRQELRRVDPNACHEGEHELCRRAQGTLRRRRGSVRRARLRHCHAPRRERPAGDEARARPAPPDRGACRRLPRRAPRNAHRRRDDEYGHGIRTATSAVTGHCQVRDMNTTTISPGLLRDRRWRSRASATAMARSPNRHRREHGRREDRL